MRQVVIGFLVALTLAIGSPMVGANPSAATLLGQLVDAGGRGEIGQSVQLVRDGVVITATETTANGEFIFSGVEPGTYVVRTTMNNRTAGTRVSVSAGESRPVTVVLPSLATASPAAGPIISIFTQVLTSTGVGVSSSLFSRLQQTADLQFIGGLDNADYSAFFRSIQGQLGTVDFSAFTRTFHIGPYGTS